MKTTMRVNATVIDEIVDNFTPCIVYNDIIATVDKGYCAHWDKTNVIVFITDRGEIQLFGDKSQRRKVKKVIDEMYETEFVDVYYTGVDPFPEFPLTLPTKHPTTSITVTDTELRVDSLQTITLDIGDANEY